MRPSSTRWGNFCVQVVDPQNQPVRLNQHDVTDAPDAIQQDADGTIMCTMPFFERGEKPEQTGHTQT
jgi:hypothetical protein